MNIIPGKLESMTTAGELQLYWIGVGSARSLLNDQTNLLIVKGNDHVMVDMGITGPKAFTRVTGLQLRDIEVILPTHSHSDHVGGIELLALDNRYVGRRFMKRPKLRIPPLRGVSARVMERNVVRRPRMERTGAGDAAQAPVLGLLENRGGDDGGR